VAVSGSGSWSAAGDVLLGGGVRVSGSGSTLAIAADSDGSGSGSLTFASTSNITVTSSTYSQVSLKYSDVQWSSGFTLSASNADVIFDKSSASTASFGGAGQVSSAELQMVTTTGVLQFGNSLATDISLKGMDRTSYSESLVLVKSTGSISFDTGATIIAKALDVRAQTDITLSADVTVLAGGYAYFLADSDSNAAGSFIVAASTTLTMSSPGVLVRITAADISLDSTCVLALSSSSLDLVSTASRGFHLGGASAGGSFVELDATEANRITTTGTWTVQSPAITVLSIVAADTHSAPVELNARSSGGLIDFAAASTFYSLNATAAAGISVAANIGTTTGQLSLDGNYDMVGDDTTSLSQALR